MGDYREFELLVARIEGALAPVGAIVTSPDYLRDNVTGELREVDASIGYSVGITALLITIECRDRVRTENVTWIEQLATKQRHLAAAHTIAVSSTGFSRAAEVAARRHGISTRTIADVSDADILAWVDTLEVEEVTTACSLGRLLLTYEGDHPGAHLEPTAEQEWQAKAWDAEIFTDQATGRAQSLIDLIRRAASEGRAGSDKSPQSVTITLPPKSTMFFSDPCLYCQGCTCRW